MAAMADTAAMAMDGSNGNNAVDKATAEKASKAAATTHQSDSNNSSDHINEAMAARASIKQRQ